MGHPVYTVTVLRSGGRDRKNNPLPTVEHDEAGALIAPRRSDDPTDRSSAPISGAWLLFRGRNDVDITSTDQVRIPEGAPMPGVWRVVGDVGDWRGDAAGGVEVSLER